MKFITYFYKEEDPCWQVRTACLNMFSIGYHNSGITHVAAVLFVLRVCLPTHANVVLSFTLSKDVSIRFREWQGPRWKVQSVLTRYCTLEDNLTWCEKRVCGTASRRLIDPRERIFADAEGRNIFCSKHVSTDRCSGCVLRAIMRIYYERFIYIRVFHIYVPEKSSKVARTDRIRNWIINIIHERHLKLLTRVIRLYC